MNFKNNQAILSNLIVCLTKGVGLCKNVRVFSFDNYSAAASSVTAFEGAT